MKIFRSKIAGLCLLFVAMLYPLESFSQSCQLVTDTCTDSTPCKTFGGYQVCLGNVNPLPAGALQIQQTCWATSQSYNCSPSTPNYAVDTCGSLSTNPNCGVISSTCTATDPTTGACTTYSDLYSCQSGGGVQSGTSCQGLTFCSGGTCFTKKDAPNNTLAKVVTAQEVAREAGYYNGPNGIFSGEADSCSQDTLGLSNCCKPNPAGGSFTDALIVDQLIQAGWSIGKTFYLGSSYTFDALFSDTQSYISQELSGITNTVQNLESGNFKALFTPSPGPVQSISVTGMMGGMIGQQLGTALLCSNCSPTMQGIAGAFGYAGGVVAGTWAYGEFETMQAGATVLMNGGTMDMVGSLTNMGGYEVTTICVSCIAITAAIIMIEALLACDQQEMQTQLKLGANICHQVGSYCSVNIPLIGCLQNTNGYCCYNSKLAKIINEQGRPQIGKGWGSAQAPDCSGFTPTQIQQIDFSKIDFSAFINDVKARAMPDPAAVAANVTNQENNFYTGTGSNPTIANGMVTTYQTGTPKQFILQSGNAVIPQMPTCTASIVKGNPTVTGDQPSTIVLSSCQANGYATFTYKGTCSSIPSGTTTTVALNSTGTGSFPITIPSACLSLINKWDVFITTSSNVLLGQETVLWQ